MTGFDAVDSSHHRLLGARGRGRSGGPRMSAYGYKRTFWGPLISVRFTPESRHTEAQCPLLGL